MAGAVTFVLPGPLAQIGRAIRAQLELVMPANVFTYQWMPGRVDREVWTKLTRRVPMVGIGFNRFHRVQTTTSLNVISEWSVYLATRNESGQEAVLFGDRLAPGLLAMMQVAGAALQGATIAGLGTIQIAEGANAFIEDYKEDGLGIGALELSVPADLSLSDVLSGPGATAGTLTGQTIAWSFDGGATVVQTDTTTGTS